VKVHVGGTSVHTGQLFFPDDLTALVFTTAPYAARGEPDTRNEEDALFEGAGGAASIPRVSGRNGSYAAAITLGVASR
jgi:hypothetical protein